MYFPESYFEDEVREGFYVNGMMKRAWAAQLEVLSEVDKVCKKHGIKWFADCGTLLGAVRHGGYIPWDDDLDICMLRDDYIKFLKVTDELPEGYDVMTIDNTPDYYELLARVTNSSEISVDEKWLEHNHQFPFPAGIDVFPLDYVAPDAEDERTRLYMVSVVGEAATCITDENQNNAKVQKRIDYIEELCAVKLDRKGSLRKQVNKLLEKLFMIYTPEISGSDEVPEEVVLMPYWHKDGSHKYKRSYFDHIVELPFETTVVNAPAVYDSVLKIEYGNYMKCILDGGVHDYPYFKKMEKQLIGASDYYPFVYDFTEDAINRVTERDIKPVYKLKDFANVAVGVQDKIAELLSEDKFDDVCSLLAKCQNVAAGISDIFARAYGHDFITTQLLNGYCEYAYVLYQAVTGRDETMVQEAYSAIDGVIAGLMDNVGELEKIKEVVFITYKPDIWRFADRIWKYFNDEPNTIVTVIPVPYYNRAMFGGFLKQNYEVEGYPDYVTLTNAEDYDLAAHHPDMIFIQNPYDDVNYTVSVQPGFYSNNLKTVTDKLVYVQSFETDEINSGNARAMLNAEYFVRTPAVVNADRVVVPSEAIREIYIQILTDYAGESTRGIWENRITSPKEWRPVPQAGEKEISDEWGKIILRADGSRKKVMLYRISASPVMEFGIKSVNKIKRALESFYDRRNDIALVLMPEGCLWDALRDFPDVFDALNKLTDDYRRAGWGIYAEDKDRQAVLDICDAYYGDAGNMVQKFRRAGKPVMIENINV